LHPFNLVALNNDGIEHTKFRYASPKGKAVVTIGDLGVYALLKMNLVIGHRFDLNKL